jgi:hypothetical protein
MIIVHKIKHEKEQIKVQYCIDAGADPWRGKAVVMGVINSPPKNAKKRSAHARV